jgi:hypothetical protein
MPRRVAPSETVRWPQRVQRSHVNVGVHGWWLGERRLGASVHHDHRSEAPADGQSAQRCHFHAGVLLARLGKT